MFKYPMQLVLLGWLGWKWVNKMDYPPFAAVTLSVAVLVELVFVKFAWRSPSQDRPEHPATKGLLG